MNCLKVVTLAISASVLSAEEKSGFDPVKAAADQIATLKVKKGDWPQWGGSSFRNNTPAGSDIPTTWDVESMEGIKWAAPVGSQTYGNPVVANGKVYIGTNNGNGYLKRYDKNKVDLGCLLCFDEETGKFLWQASSEKLPTGRVHDWPQQGICCAPFVEGDKCWYVTSRGEVLCLDTEGFHDGENDGPFLDEMVKEKDEADIIWRLDMMKDLRLSQHNMCSCSVTCLGDTLFVVTGNGVDEGHVNIPAPDAPSFIAVDRNTGKVLWQDKTPGINILHGQWGSPTVAELAGKKQVLMPGGDGWLYSFNADAKDQAELLWKFDCNPKWTKYILGGAATRNHLIATPVVYDGLVYVAVGEDPEHGEGVGNLWCIDPSKSGDVSPELVFNKKEGDKPIAHKRDQACDRENGDYTKPNPNSALVWHMGAPIEQPAKKAESPMHRTCGTVTIKDNILYIADFSGFFHCLDAKTGKLHWTYDMLSACWSSPLIVDNKVYIGDEDGDVAIFEHSTEMKKINEINMNNAVYTTPVVANNVLYIANRTHLFAIAKKK